MEEDYQYYADNFSFDKEAEHECENCGKSGANLYNAFGQALTSGGFSSDLMLCALCHKERFEDKNDRIHNNN